MRLIGYARASESTSSFGKQIYELKSVGCEKIFLERLPLKYTDLKQLQCALDSLVIGDVLVVTKLDRLATSIVNLNVIVKKLQKKQVVLNCTEY